MDKLCRFDRGYIGSGYSTDDLASGYYYTGDEKATAQVSVIIIDISRLSNRLLQLWLEIIVP